MADTNREVGVQTWRMFQKANLRRLGTKLMQEAILLTVMLGVTIWDRVVIPLWQFARSLTHTASKKETRRDAASNVNRISLKEIIEAFPGAMLLLGEVLTFLVVGTIQTVLFSSFLLIVVFMAVAGGLSLLVHMNAALQLPILSAIGTPELMLVHPIDPLIAVVLLMLSAAAFFCAYSITSWKLSYLYLGSKRRQ